MRYGIEDYLTIHEAATVLGRRYQTVWGWVKNGRLEAMRIGNLWLINPDNCRIPKPGKPGRPRKSK